MASEIDDLWFAHERLFVLLTDEREISVPLWWYPKLASATREQRANWRILPFKDAVHWPDLDEDLDVEGMILGLAAPGAQVPEKAA